MGKRWLATRPRIRLGVDVKNADNNNSKTKKKLNKKTKKKTKK